MTSTQHLAVRRIFNARHKANIAALDDDPRSPAYAWGERAALAERATAFNALAAHKNAPWFLDGHSATPHPSNFGGRGWGVLSVGDVEMLSSLEAKP